MGPAVHSAVMAALLLPVSLPAASPGAAEALPIPEHTARYTVRQRGREAGYLDVQLRGRDDGGYDYTLVTTATSTLLRLLGVAINEQGHFEWQEDRIRPVSYGQLITRPGRNRFWEAEFDWQALRATGRSHRGELDVALVPGVLDPLTLRLQLAIEMSRSGAAAPAWEFAVLERNQVERQQFLPRARESFRLPGGCLPVLRLERLREDDDRGYNSWHAEAFHWLPVRIQQLREGVEDLDLQLEQTSLQLPLGACPE